MEDRNSWCFLDVEEQGIAENIGATWLTRFYPPPT